MSINHLLRALGLGALCFPVPDVQAAATITTTKITASVNTVAV
jgi:hypothetical protein